MGGGCVSGTQQQVMVGERVQRGGGLDHKYVPVTTVSVESSRALVGGAGTRHQDGFGYRWTNGSSLCLGALLALALLQSI